MSEQPDTPPKKIVPSKRSAKRAIIIGAGLALLCHALPHEHREICHAVAKAVTSFCTGGQL